MEGERKEEEEVRSGIPRNHLKSLRKVFQNLSDFTQRSTPKFTNTSQNFPHHLLFRSTQNPFQRQEEFRVVKGRKGVERSEFSLKTFTKKKQKGRILITVILNEESWKKSKRKEERAPRFSHLEFSPTITEISIKHDQVSRRFIPIRFSSWNYLCVDLKWMNGNQFPLFLFFQQIWELDITLHSSIGVPLQYSCNSKPISSNLVSCFSSIGLVNPTLCVNTLTCTNWPHAVNFIQIMVLTRFFVSDASAIQLYQRLIIDSVFIW